MKLFHIYLSYGAAYAAAESKEQVLDFLKDDGSHGIYFPLENIKGEPIPEKDLLESIVDTGYTVEGNPGIINWYQE